MKKIYFTLLLGVIVLWGCSSNKQVSSLSQVKASQDQSFNQLDEMEKYTLTTWTISNSQTYIWYIQPAEKTYISTKIWWRISQLNGDKSDRIYKWEILWSLDNQENNVSMQWTNDTLGSMDLVYSNTSMMYDSQINVMQEKLTQAQNSIDIAKRAMEWMEIWVSDTQTITQTQLATAKKQADQAQIGIDSVQIQIQNAKQTLSQSESDVYSNSKTAISRAQTLAKSVLGFVDENLWISTANKNKNDSFEIYLSAKDSSYKPQTENLYKTVEAQYEELTKKTNEIISMNLDDISTNQQKKDGIVSLLKEYNDFLTSLQNLTSMTYKVFDLSVSSPTFPAETIAALKNQTLSFQNNIDSAILTAEWNYLMWIKWSIQSIENFNKQSKSTLDNLQKQLDLTKKQYDTALEAYNQYKAISEWKINDVQTQKDIAKKQYEIAQNQYKEILANIESIKQQKQASLAQVKSQISQIKTSKNMVWVSLSNGVITSPIDGVIVEKLANIWQVIGAWTPIFAVADDSLLKVNVFIPENDLQSVKIWDAAEVSIKALNKNLTWNITNISPITDEMSKKIQIEIQIPNPDKTIKIWMYTEVSILGGEKQGIKLPRRFIKNEYGSSYVSVLTGNLINKIPLPGMECQNDDCFVFSGLNIWTVIVNN